MKRFFLLGTIIFAVTTLTVGTPYIYNFHLSPLAQLHDKIHPQSTYADLEPLFVEYYEEYGATGVVHFSREKTHLFLYHDSYFDDLQLQVQFGDDGHVTEILFVGD